MKKELTKKELESASGGDGLVFLELLSDVISYVNEKTHDKKYLQEQLIKLESISKEVDLYDKFVESDLYKDLKRRIGS